jgi:hypothetical protein
MEAERKKMKLPMKNNLMWLLVGVVIIGGIYFLSYYDVDEAVVSESKTFIEFVRAALR